MRFWVVTALRYIKSEEITPVELMTANELGSQPAHSAKTSFSTAGACMAALGLPTASTSSLLVDE